MVWLDPGIKSRLSGGVDGPHVLQVILHEYYFLPWAFHDSQQQTVGVYVSQEGCGELSTQASTHRSSINQVNGRRGGSSYEIQGPDQGPYLMGYHFPTSLN